MSKLTKVWVSFTGFGILVVNLLTCFGNDGQQCYSLSCYHAPVSEARPALEEGDLRIE